MTLSYEKIFSMYRGIVDDPLELSLSPDDLLEIYVERLGNVAGLPNVIAKFSSFDMDDEIQTLTFELKNPSKIPMANEKFVIKLFSLGMAIEWLEPQVNARDKIEEILGTDKEKKLQDHYKASTERLKEMKTEFNNLLRSHGYINNSYLDGGSA